MLFAKRRLGLLTLVTAIGLVTGCDVLNRASGDEEREMHYVQGLNWKIQGQTDKAIESFSRALQVNPNSAAAHLALGDLHYDKTHAFIVSAYHYSEYRRLKTSREPGFKPSDIDDRIKACELQVAAKYADSIGRQQVQIEVEGLKLDVARLTEENRILRRAAGIEGLRVAATNPPPAGAAVQRQPQSVPDRRTNAPPATRGPAAQAPLSASGQRVHKVVAGDTPSTIARRYGVPLKSLMAANPGLRPSQLRVGQSVNVPPK
jgi:nucleoid-associated protein YgaU